MTRPRRVVPCPPGMACPSRPPTTPARRPPARVNATSPAARLPPPAPHVATRLIPPPGRMGVGQAVSPPSLWWVMGRRVLLPACSNRRPGSSQRVWEAAEQGFLPPSMRQEANRKGGQVAGSMR